ncbi:hypothetical protein PROFUN_12236 [Planoprotostelium fungivorum]|uniref:Uncharacterized protein n=1 Tax=Planoprotostelium fungivorum TaxID=1890364 RepID=A0A2P6N879_9EUKA|nr:hypothetical protein PROFUN_12236 [Planoprotostelium fungivorum]
MAARLPLGKRLIEQAQSTADPLAKARLEYVGQLVDTFPARAANLKGDLTSFFKNTATGNFTVVDVKNNFWKGMGVVLAFQLGKTVGRPQPLTWSYPPSSH